MDHARAPGGGGPAGQQGAEFEHLTRPTRTCATQMKRMAAWPAQHAVLLCRDRRWAERTPDEDEDGPAAVANPTVKGKPDGRRHCQQREDCAARS